MEQEVARAEGLRVHPNQGWSGRGGTQSEHGRGRARGGHTQGRGRNERGIWRAEVESNAAMEWQESATRDLLEEQDDGGRWRNSGVGERATRGRAEKIDRAATGAVNVPTEGGGRRSKPAEDGPSAREVYEGKYTT